MKIIDNPQALAELCDRLSRDDYVTVDTEFIRDNSYYSRLCLIQVGGSDGAAIIDPLADGMDLGPFFGLLADRDTLKVFHAARQDIEIFLHMAGNVPAPLFDSQVAAMVCGFGDAVSYEKLVARLTGAKLDKSQRFTDWSRRPLTRRQIDYAAGDVTHLRGVYQELRAKLEENRRMDWLAEEMEVLTSPSTYLIDKRQVWRRLKTRSTSRRFLGIVREVAAWREEEAQQRDVPRNRVIRDEAILEVSAHPPRTVDDLRRLRSLPGAMRSGKRCAGLLEAIEAGRAVPDSELPKAAKQVPVGAGIGPLVELLKVLLKHSCAEHAVAQKLVASVADLEKIATDDKAAVPALHGWREGVFGANALALKHGRIALSAKGRKVVLVPMDGAGNAPAED